MLSPVAAASAANLPTALAPKEAPPHSADRCRCRGRARRRQASDLHDGDVGEQHLTGSMRQSVSQLQKSFDVQFVSTGLTTRSSHTAEKQALYYFTRG